MLQYLVILLDDTSVSFCHYSNPIKERRLMPLGDAKPTYKKFLGYRPGVYVIGDKIVCLLYTSRCV